MIDIVNEVYPEYQDQISLVDINVYDDLNKNLLTRANIHSIPTQIFFIAAGLYFLCAAAKQVLDDTLHGGVDLLCRDRPFVQRSQETGQQLVSIELYPITILFDDCGKRNSTVS